MKLWLPILLALSTPAFAGSGTITGKDAAGATKTFDVITDGAGNFVGMQGICDGTAAATCAAVKAASTPPAVTDPAAVVSIADGNSVTIGTKADAAWVSGSGSVVAILKAISGLNTTIAASVQAAIPAAANLTTNIGQVGGEVNITPTDCSIQLTLGGQAQNILGASATRHGFTIANIDATTGSGEPIWISFTTTAAANTIASFPLAAPTATTYAGLSSYTTPLGFGLNTAVSVVAANTNHKISCVTW